MTPAVGQTWSALFTRRGFGQARATFRIDRIEDGTAHGTLLVTGKPARMELSALASGTRGAHLVRDADGTEVATPGERLWGHRVNRRMRDAEARLARGSSVQSVAEHFRVAENTVRNWARLVRAERGEQVAAKGRAS